VSTSIYILSFYHTGKRLIECLLEAKKWPKSIPQITDKGVARLVAQELIQASFFHRSDKVEDKKGYLQVIVFIFNSWLTNR